MHRCTDLFPGQFCLTRILISERARKDLGKYSGPEFRTKLERWARSGLWNYLGKDFPLRSEGGGVFRLADRSSSVRVCGFFESGNVNGDRFIAVTVFKKKGMKFPTGLIEEITGIRDRQEWRVED